MKTKFPFITLHKRGFRPGEEERVQVNANHIVAIENDDRALVIVVGGRHYEVTESADKVLAEIIATFVEQSTNE